MREINSEEVYLLKECLSALAEHHNKVSVNFRGCFPKEPFDDTLARFSAELSEGRSAITVIEDAGRIIGFCKISFSEAIGVLEYLVVLSGHRGNGYGARLTDWAVSRFDELGIRKIDVKVVDGNEAVSLYEKYGFKMHSHILRLTR